MMTVIQDVEAQGRFPSASDFAHLYVGAVEPQYQLSLWHDLPYYKGNTNFYEGRISYHGVVYDQVLLRFDQLKQRVVVLSPVGNVCCLPDQTYIDWFEMDGHRYVHDPEDSSRYAYLLCDGSTNGIRLYHCEWKIYTGEITNWKEVGGVDHAITPYIRNADSGSQEKMETLVMQGLTMIDRTDENYMYEIIGSQMISPYAQLEIDEYGIGYTPFFYCTAMVRDLMRVDMLSIDGVAPTKESLRSNKYPFVSSIYAAVRKTENHESMAYKLYQFLFTKKGADMIDESGYIAIR